MKRVANEGEPVVVVPPIVKPVEVEVALRAVPVEVRHVAVAVNLADGMWRVSSMPPPLEYSLAFSRLYLIRNHNSITTYTKYLHFWK
jgi:hypothetical protein